MRCLCTYNVCNISMSKCVTRMLHIYIILLYYTFYVRAKYHQEIVKDDENYDRVQLHNRLNHEWSNSVCCLKNLRCCHNEPSIEVRAILMKCPNTHSTVRDESINHKMDQPGGSEGDDPLKQTTIRNCRKKLILTIKLHTPREHATNCEYIIIDHVYDVFTKSKAKILIPYVVKLKQEVVIQMYRLQFYHLVNSKVREEIYNKHTPNYTGCDTSSKAPTCGKITYKGKDVPFSEGFCCSCDAIKNMQRQPKPKKYEQDFIDYSNPEFLLDEEECPRHLKASDVRNEKGPPPPLEMYEYINPKEENIKLENRIYVNPDLLGKQSRRLNDAATMHEIPSTDKINKNTPNKRQIESSGDQIRGGQNCANRYTPKNQTSETYHESAHCLRFSNLWYTVYRLQKPELEHSLLLQVFERHEDINGHIIWKDITKDKMARVGTLKCTYVDERQSISIKYSSNVNEIDQTTFAINYKTALLLIPDGVPKIEYAKYPEIQNGPHEYLIVHNNQISINGDQCNVGGVGFEAFAKQQSRCDRPRGTCLANQPHDLWLHDHQAAKLDKKGCFFLKHYGSFPENPIRRDSETKEQYLVMDYTATQSIKVDIQIRADFNTILRAQSSAKITEVYIDSTAPTKTIIAVKITNSGLISTSFTSRLTDCPMELPASSNNVESIPALIPPQHQHIFHLTINGVLPVDRFLCTVEALNRDREVAALRRIRIQQFDRCFCTWHCLCACVGSSEGLKCVPMSLQQYHAAGFWGSLPVASVLVHYTFIDSLLTFIMYLIFAIIFMLLTLGTVKGMIGIFYSPSIGTWGLDIILDLPKPIKRYYEKDITSTEVIYDNQGWPIHPTTKKRVRCISKSTEFCINVLFLFIYPINVCILTNRRLCKKRKSAYVKVFKENKFFYRLTKVFKTTDSVKLVGANGFTDISIEKTDENSINEAILNDKNSPPSL